MPLIQIRLIEGTTSEEQKRQIIERVTDAVVSVKGEPLRTATWVILDDVKSGEWGVGGQGVTTADVLAQLRDEPALAELG